MAEVKLLPCPFCGGKARSHMGAYQCSYVICLNCRLESPTAKDREAAIEYWNTRKPDARLSELKDTLVEAAREACLVLMDEGYGGANPTLQRLDAALSAAALFEQEKAALEKRQ